MINKFLIILNIKYFEYFIHYWLICLYVIFMSLWKFMCNDFLETVWTSKIWWDTRNSKIFWIYIFLWINIFDLINIFRRTSVSNKWKQTSNSQKCNEKFMLILWYQHRFSFYRSEYIIYINICQMHCFFIVFRKFYIIAEYFFHYYLK